MYMFVFYEVSKRHFFQSRDENKISLIQSRTTGRDKNFLHLVSAFYLGETYFFYLSHNFCYFFRLCDPVPALMEISILETRENGKFLLSILCFEAKQEFLLSISCFVTKKSFLMVN